MGRKKIDPDNKKVHFGISINPELAKLLEEQANKEDKSKSKLIEDVMIEFLKNKI